jgi:hypothetical protein
MSTNAAAVAASHKRMIASGGARARGEGESDELEVQGESEEESGEVAPMTRKRGRKTNSNMLGLDRDSVLGETEQFVPKTEFVRVSTGDSIAMY